MAETLYFTWPGPTRALRSDDTGPSLALKIESTICSVYIGNGAYDARPRSFRTARR